MAWLALPRDDALMHQLRCWFREGITPALLLQVLNDVCEPREALKEASARQGMATKEP